MVFAILRLFVDRKMSCVSFQSISDFQDGKDTFKVDVVVIKTLVFVCLKYLKFISNVFRICKSWKIQQFNLLLFPLSSERLQSQCFATQMYFGRLSVVPRLLFRIFFDFKPNHIKRLHTRTEWKMEHRWSTSIVESHASDFFKIFALVAGMCYPAVLSAINQISGTSLKLNCVIVPEWSCLNQEAFQNVIQWMNMRSYNSANVISNNLKTLK